METASGFQVQRIANIREAGDGTSLFVTLWEFEVKSGSEELFEQAYGSEGGCERLLRRNARYRGTLLLRDVRRERVYVTMDLWELRKAYEEFRVKWASPYAEIDRRCEGLTAVEKHLGRL